MMTSPRMRPPDDCIFDVAVRAHLAALLVRQGDVELVLDDQGEFRRRQGVDAEVFAEQRRAHEAMGGDLEMQAHEVAKFGGGIGHCSSLAGGREAMMVARSTALSILPVGLRGSSSTTRTKRGIA